MKKLIVAIVAFFMVYGVQAQNHFGQVDREFEKEMFRISASIVFVIFLMMFIVAILKRILDHRLKNKVMEKGISENLAISVLQPAQADDRSMSIKWFFILACLGGGLTAVNYTLPLGFHSLAIMAFSISLSFLAYYFFLGRKK